VLLIGPNMRIWRKALDALGHTILDHDALARGECRLIRERTIAVQVNGKLRAHRRAPGRDNASMGGSAGARHTSRAPSRQDTSQGDRGAEPIVNNRRMRAPASIAFSASRSLRRAAGSIRFTRPRTAAMRQDLGAIYVEPFPSRLGYELRNSRHRCVGRAADLPGRLSPCA